MNQVIMSKFIRGIVLVVFVFFVGTSTFAQQSKSSSKSKPTKINSVRKAQMVAVNTIPMSHGAAASSINTHQEISSEDRIGVEYHPLANVDTGSALLQERKFKWHAYYHLNTKIISRAPFDYLLHLHAVAAVAGDGFPTVMRCESGQFDSKVSFNIAGLSFQFPSFSSDEKTPSLDFFPTESNQNPIEESGPREQSLYKYAKGYAMADVDYGTASQLKAIAVYKYNTLPTYDPEQYTTKEAFVYPYSAR